MICIEAWFDIQAPIHFDPSGREYVFIYFFNNYGIIAISTGFVGNRQSPGIFAKIFCPPDSAAGFVVQRASKDRIYPDVRD